jgi:hypothetical protein
MSALFACIKVFPEQTKNYGACREAAKQTLRNAPLGRVHPNRPPSFVDGYPALRGHGCGLRRRSTPRWHEVPFGKVFGPTFLQKGGLWYNIEAAAGGTAGLVGYGTSALYLPRLPESYIY